MQQADGQHADGPTGPAVPPPLPKVPFASYTHPVQRAPSPSEKWLIPVGRSGWSIAAGYAGLFAFLVLPAPLALLFGILALKELRKDPQLGGHGRAWFGVIAGALFSVVLAFALLMLMVR